MNEPPVADDVDELRAFSQLLDAASPEPLTSADRSARRRRRRRGWLIALLVFALVLAGTGGYVVWALMAAPPPPTATIRTPTVTTPSAAAFAMPAEGAAAISVTGAADYLGPDGIQLASDATGTGAPRAIASISKLITALVVLDAHPLSGASDPGPTITFSKADHALYDKYYVLGAAILDMPTGSSMSLHDALATMLIPSASNYAEAVSTWAFGSQGAFLAATRAWLTAHDLTGTSIVEPTGISPRNTSTTSDLLKIGALAAANPTIAQITATDRMTVPGLGTLVNTNDLLGQDGITGLKTGNLGAGTFSLLYTASLNVGAGEPLTVTGAVLDGFSRESVDADVLGLLSSIRAGFHHVPVATAGEVIGTFETEWGASAELVIADDAAILTWSDTPIAVTMDTATPVTYTDGERVGSVTWTAGPNTVTAPVEVRGAIEPPTDWWRLTHPSRLGLSRAGSASAG